MLQKARVTGCVKGVESKPGARLAGVLLGLAVCMNLAVAQVQSGKPTSADPPLHHFSTPALHQSPPQFSVPGAREYLRDLSRVVLQQTGTNAQGLYAQARLQSCLGDKADALQTARRALSLDTNLAEVAVFAADLLIREDRLAEARDLLQGAVGAKPGTEGGYRRLGMVLDRLGEHEPARAAFKAGVERTPQDATGWLLHGKSLLDRGETAEAVASLEKACQLEPESANAYYPLFQAYSKLDKQEAARAALARFHELKKVETRGMGTLYENLYDNERELRKVTAGFHLDIGTMLLKQGQRTLAKSHLRQALSIAPDDPQPLERLSSIQLSAGELTEARGTLGQLLALQPTNAQAKANLGTVLLQLKENAAAVEQFKGALKLDPGQAPALYNLARFYLSTGQELGEALSLAQRLVDASPIGASYDLLAWALYANGRFNDAVKAAAQAVEKDPANEGYRTRFIRLQERVGNKMSR